LLTDTVITGCYIFQIHESKFLHDRSFKTNITDHQLAKTIISHLIAKLPHSLINFDLDDCDCILRIEGKEYCVDVVMNYFIGAGYFCEVLD